MNLQVDGNGFVFDPERKIWLPPLNPKQFEIFQDRHRYLLVHGPRKSGKTFGICHKVIRHAFETNFAMVAIICKTIKNAKAAGVWVLIVRMMQFWVSGCSGFKIVEGPKQTGDSKMSFVRIRNIHGGISEIQCHSMEHAEEVEAKFKGPAYSFLWLSEFDQYCDAHAFDILSDSLRMTPMVKYEDHQIVADCNPPDTGEDNWIHDKWFKFKEAEPEEDETEGEKELRENLHQMLVMVDDNPQLHPKERRDLDARYRKRKSLHDRFVKGLWTQDITDGHFSDVWDEDVHVVGRVDVAEKDWEVLIPTASCRELLTGWDIGEMKSHSFHILEKLMWDVQDKEGNRHLVVAFHVIDELVVVKQFVSVADFTRDCLKKMEHWEKWQKTRYGVDITWRHWADTSAFDTRASSNQSDAAIVYEASGKKIILQGAPKYRDSNKDKVNLIWEFLHARRLKVSAQLFRTKRMFAMLRPDPKSTQSKYVKRDDHKHPFDSMSYPILAEAPIDMFKSAEVDMAAKESSPRPVYARI